MGSYPDTDTDPITVYCYLSVGPLGHNHRLIDLCNVCA